MWIRKPEEKIQDYLNQCEAKRRGLLRPLLVAVVLTASTLILYQWGCRGGSIRSGVIMTSTPGAFTFGTFLAGILLFGIYFAFFVYVHRHKGLYSPWDSLLCRRCKRPSRANPEGMCQCGGELEPFEFFAWEEEVEH